MQKEMINVVLLMPQTLCSWCHKFSSDQVGSISSNLNRIIQPEEKQQKTKTILKQIVTNRGYAHKALINAIISGWLHWIGKRGPAEKTFHTLIS